MKRILAFVLALAMALCLCSCSSAQTEEELKKELCDLLEQGVGLAKDVYLGEGLEANVPEDAVIDPYAPTAYFPVIEGGYKSVDDIKKATRAIFSPQLCESWLYPDGFGTDTPLYKDADGVLYVDIFGGPLTAYGVEWVYDSFELTNHTDISATATVKKYINDYEEVTATVTFVMTDDGWRIDSPLF